MSVAGVGALLTPGRPIPVLMLARELGCYGGIERDISKFARQLGRYGIEPHVACFRPGGARWSEIADAGIPIFSIAVTSFKSRSAISGALELRRYVAEHQIQVLHAFDAAANLFGMPAARWMGIPVALTSHLWCREFLPFWMQIALAAADTLATGLFVNSHAVADNLASKWRVPANRIHVCHNGFEPHEFFAGERARPKQVRDASVVIGTVAVLREEKNIHLLVEAFAAVHKIDASARLLIVGEGPMRETVQQRARDLAIVESCIFENATPHPADWMRAIDVFVLPSRSEAFPNSLLEAMACGCCPVVSRVGGTPELVSHNERGILVAPNDVQQLAEALIFLTKEPGRRLQMAESAARFVHDSLTIDIAASRLASIYKHLLAERGRVKCSGSS